MKELTPEQLELIKKPLPKDAVKEHPTKKGMSTIKAIFVTERLNDVFGVGKWHLQTDLLATDGTGSLFSIRTFTTGTGKERTEYFAVAKTIFTIPEYDIYYECVAGASNDDMGDAAKGATTDCLTKICSWLGIGIDVFKGQQDQAVREYERAEATALSKEVTIAITKLSSLDTVDGLAKYRDSLAPEVVASPEFKSAAKQRYTEIAPPK